MHETIDLILCVSLTSDRYRLFLMHLFLLNVFLNSVLFFPLHPVMFSLRRHSVSIHQRSNSTSHHHSHNENQPLRRNRRQSESQPKRTSLSQSPSAIVETNQNMTLSNAPLTSPKSTSPNPKSPSVKHPPPLSVKHPPPLSVKLPPPSAPAIVMGEKTKSVFTFPSSSSEDTVTNTSTPLQTNTSTNTSTITPSSNNKPVDKTSAASNHPIPSAAISQRHSTSPMRETHVDSSRRLSDSDLNTPSKGKISITAEIKNKSYLCSAVGLFVCINVHSILATSFKLELSNFSTSFLM